MAMLIEADGTLTILQKINRLFFLKLDRLLEGQPEFLRLFSGDTLVVNKGLGSRNLPVNAGATSLLEERDMTFSDKPPKSLPMRDRGKLKVRGTALLVSLQEINYVQKTMSDAKHPVIIKSNPSTALSDSELESRLRRELTHRGS